MIAKVLISAGLTGIFCSGFAMLIDVATDMLGRGEISLFSFASGFLGSLFAQTVLSRWREKGQ